MSTPIQDLRSAPPPGQPGEQKEKRSQAQIDYDEGRGYLERGEPTLAAPPLHNALHGFEEEGNKEGIANASNQLGHACLQRKDFDKALAHYERAWAICEELGDAISLLALSKQLVFVYSGLKHYRKALDTCLDLLDSYHRNNDPKGTVATLEMMADVYTDSGDREKAADAYLTIASIHANFKHHNIAESFREKAARAREGAM